MGQRLMRLSRGRIVHRLSSEREYLRTACRLYPTEGAVDIWPAEQGMRGGEPCADCATTTERTIP